MSCREEMTGRALILALSRVGSIRSWVGKFGKATEKCRKTA